MVELHPGRHAPVLDVVLHVEVVDEQRVSQFGVAHCLIQRESCFQPVKEKRVRGAELKQDLHQLSLRRRSHHCNAHSSGHLQRNAFWASTFKTLPLRVATQVWLCVQNA